MTLAILVGGKSTRFGSDKCTHNLGSFRSVDMIVTNIGALFEEIIFVGENQNLNGSIPDAKPGMGPISGLYTALLRSRNDVFLISCDMPFVKEEIVRFILKMTDHHEVVCPIIDDIYQVTHAFYSKKIIPYVEDEMLSKNPSLKSLISKCNDVLLINENEFIEFGDYKKSFFNFNFRHDLQL